MSALKVQRMSRHISKPTNWALSDVRFVKRPGALKKINECAQRLGGRVYEFTITVRVTNKDTTKLNPRTFKQLTKQLFDESWALQPQHFFFYSEFKDVIEGVVAIPEKLSDQDFLCMVEVEEVEAENALREQHGRPQLLTWRCEFPNPETIPTPGMLSLLGVFTFEKNFTNVRSDNTCWYQLSYLIILLVILTY